MLCPTEQLLDTTYPPRFPNERETENQISKLMWIWNEKYNSFPVADGKPKTLKPIAKRITEA